MNLKTILALSLVANLALAGAFAWAYKGRAPASTAPETTVTPGTTTIPKRAKTESSEPAGSTPGTEGIKPMQSFDWRLVESDDYKKYIANLRSIGCPEETIRDIIVADVNKLFESRKKELVAGGKKFEYWKGGNPFSTMVDPDRLEKQQKLTKEKQELLKELLGVVPDEKFDMFAGFNPFESMLDFLPADKQNKIMQLFQDMQVKMAKQMKSGTPDSDDMKGMQKVQKEMDAELAKLLSPQEYEDYQLRMSQTAMTMRMQLAGFEPTEEEFRKVFFEKKKFDDEYSMFTAGTEEKEEREKRTAAKKEMDAKLKELLGDARWTEYERAQDYEFQNIAKITEKNNLGKDVAVKVYDMKKLAQDEAKKVQSDKSLSSEQRTAALQAIRSETENTVKGVLGETGYKSYEKNAWWLKQISPDRPKTVPTSAPVQP